MSHRPRSIGESLIALGLAAGVWGVYHLFATNQQDITHARVTDKHIDSRLVCRKGRCHTEYDYFIETDKGTICDEWNMWLNKWSSGSEYNDIVIDQTYDFHVSHDKVSNSDNVMSCKKVAAGPEAW